MDRVNVQQYQSIAQVHNMYSACITILIALLISESFKG